MYYAKNSTAKDHSMMGIRIASFAAMLVFVGDPLSFGTETAMHIAIDNADIQLSPYVWKCSGTGPTARAEATLPGAYLKAVFQNSTTVGILIDGVANQDSSVPMPVVDFSVDGGQFQAVQLSKRNEVYSIPLAKKLDNSAPHRIEFYFRSASLWPDRWGASTVHLRIAGIALDAGGSLLPCPMRTKRAIGFGDSITEGVCNEGSCPYYSNLMMNNARTTWFPLVCAALNCEYGQLGSGGWGMLKPMSLPPLSQSWDHYDAATSRLKNGLMLPEPDYVFCCIGTNDRDDDGMKRKHWDIKAAYTKWLAALRKACPNTQIFCITSPLGWHTAEIAAAVATRNKDGDAKVHLIDVTPLTSGYSGKCVAMQFAPDGFHPTVYGNAMLGTLIGVEAQKVLNNDKR
jgi:lysophospholipase L1-like esterase